MTSPPRTDLSHFFGFTGGTPTEAVLSALAFEPYLTGRQPHSAEVDLHEVAADAPLAPPGITPDLTHDENGLRSHLATGPGWTLFAAHRRRRAAVVRVCAETAVLARDVLALTTATAGAAPATDDTVSIGFWHEDPTGSGGARAVRPIDVPDWPEIRRNYADTTAAALDRLMAVEPATVTGRLVLLHGPTGTGKTTALRALAHSWRRWCQVDCVLDPDALLKKPAYLTDMVLGAARSDDGAGRWRLLLLEDCDELVRSDAKHGTGQALSRLLNLTDGLLGQGLDVLVCLTTNEDVARLHPAVVRPGRCLAEIEVGPLPPAQARHWLDGAGSTASIGRDGATLAELYQLRGDVTKVRHADEPASVGNYL